jgi:hypothetical protein
MAIGLRVGAVPAKVMVPVMDEAANATPGHAAAIIRLAARNTRVAVLRIVVSFVKVLELFRDSTPDPPSRQPASARLTCRA